VSDSRTLTNAGSALRQVDLNVVYYHPSYGLLKHAALLIGWQHPWTGVGAGMFSQALAVLKTQGRLPA
jgi:hypothetical protein